jgi:hypothetical protein
LRLAEKKPLLRHAQKIGQQPIAGRIHVETR